MKKILTDNSAVWLRLAFAVSALFIAAQMAKPSAGMSGLPKPGVQEW